MRPSAKGRSTRCPLHVGGVPLARGGAAWIADDAEGYTRLRSPKQITASTHVVVTAADAGPPGPASPTLWAADVSPRSLHGSGQRLDITALGTISEHPELLSRLVKHRNPTVRATAVLAEPTGTTARAQLSADDPVLAAAAAAHPALTADEVESAVPLRPHPLVRAAIAARADVDDTTWIEAALDPHPLVRGAARSSRKDVTHLRRHLTGLIAGHFHAAGWRTSDTTARSVHGRVTRHGAVATAEQLVVELSAMAPPCDYVEVMSPL